MAFIKLLETAKSLTAIRTLRKGVARCTALLVAQRFTFMIRPLLMALITGIMLTLRKEFVAVSILVALNVTSRGLFARRNWQLGE